ncbi:probable protein phosphatase 2C 55 [Salvia miltiorrhiza]|uniref:probable protein phosphatase 2C 55 n=1 Tax=Salvia miltiorrhiza TaxID=226208 RepID=UPI0025AD2D21|nr:probable protein phosphatase 2C 55 [Salvia miltiorrhiza]
MADSFYIPKERKPPAKPDGEDAHFFFQKAQVIGVADGVGGWAKKGVDAGEYARELMRNAADAVKGCSVPAAVNPKSVLASAFAKTESPGSSTACIISLAGSRLRAVSIGDSGFAVIRGGRTVYRSPAQQSRFNAPYQLGGTSGEGLESAAEMEVEVESGDVVIAATDGFFDNVFPEEAEGMVGRCLSHGMTSAMVARELATAAHSRSRQSDAVVPFGVAAREAGMEYSGGKADDITVVVAYVMPYVNSCCLHSFTGYLWSF